MPRSLILAALFASSACAAIWPEQMGPYQRQSVSRFFLPPDPEDGLEAGEGADYGPFQVKAFRYKDTTGAYAVSLELSGVRVGNYLVKCDGKCPKDLPQLADASLPHVSHTSVPILNTYLPPKGLVPRSERYILGPVSLERFESRIAPSVAALKWNAPQRLAPVPGAGLKARRRTEGSNRNHQTARKRLGKNPVFPVYAGSLWSRRMAGGN